MSVAPGIVEYTNIRQQTPCRDHLGAVGAQSPPSLVVVDEKLEAVAFVKRALVCDGIHEDKRFCPTDVRF